MSSHFLGVLLLVPGISLAQFKCTMPNGVVIYKQLSGCPADAVKAEPVDRVPDTVKPQFKGEYRTPTPLTPAPAPPKERNIVDEAQGLRKILKAFCATTCEVDVNVFSPSYIDATLPTTPRDAARVCSEVKKWTSQPGSPFIGRGWQLKLLSPLGAGTRPMAQCTL